MKTKGSNIPEIIDSFFNLGVAWTDEQINVFHTFLAPVACRRSVIALLSTRTHSPLVRACVPRELLRAIA